MLALWQAAVAGGEDPLRHLVEVLVQGALEAEMTQFLGAQPHERTEQRRGYRNGFMPRTLTTRVGRLELQVPRDREGRFRTELFDRYQRSEKALVLSLMEPPSPAIAGFGAPRRRDVCAGGFDAEGEEDHRGAVRSGGVQEPGL